MNTLDSLRSKLKQLFSSQKNKTTPEISAEIIKERNLIHLIQEYKTFAIHPLSDWSKMYHRYSLTHTKHHTLNVTLSHGTTARIVFVDSDLLIDSDPLKNHAFAIFYDDEINHSDIQNAFIKSWESKCYQTTQGTEELTPIHKEGLKTSESSGFTSSIKIKSIASPEKMQAWTREESFEDEKHIIFSHEMYYIYTS